MDWRERVADKLLSPDEAVKLVKSGDTVMVAPFTCTPFTLCEALMRRKDELQDVRIDHPAALFPWVVPGAEKAFRVRDNFGTPANREAINGGRQDYLPIGYWQAHTVPPGYLEEYDVFLVPLSPPDEKGYCSFGPGVWMSKSVSQNAKLVIAEVQESFIRTGGENFIHVSDVDHFVVAEKPTGTVPLPPRTEEESAVTEVICALVASELVEDRDTLQIGIGTVSSALALFLNGKHDLGIQSEMIPGGVTDLVEQGVVTGRYKDVHPLKVVASALVAMPQEEMDYISDNPTFELYDFGYTDDLRMLIRQQNFKAVNNALMVDLTGQVTAEYIGPRVWSGVGGQTVFCIAAAYCPGGRSITVLPSSHLVNGERRTRIVPVFDAGTVVTVPRTFVDYVVTEYGIASLRGKTVRERVQELISIAHPDFRGELWEQAKRLHGVEA